MRRKPANALPRKRTAPRRRTSVVLVDDQAIIRRGIRALLGQEPDIIVVGEARDGVQAIAATRRLDPDVVLMDIGMPNMNGIEATRQIHEIAPRSRVLILSAHSDDDYIKAVIAMGAVGYVLKQSCLTDLARAIRKTGKGGTAVSPMVRRRLREMVPPRARPSRS